MLISAYSCLVVSSGAVVNVVVVVLNCKVVVVVSGRVVVVVAFTGRVVVVVWFVSFIGRVVVVSGRVVVASSNVVVVVSLVKSGVKSVMVIGWVVWDKIVSFSVIEAVNVYSPGGNRMLNVSKLMSRVVML